jgi:Ulp1 family protease
MHWIIFHIMNFSHQAVSLVPLQNNTWDCGVFVCRYAYALYELRHREFTYGDAGMYCEEGGITRGSESRAFHDLVSGGPQFDFNMKDISRFREEFKTLIERLSVVYQKMKSAEKEPEHE